jgi:CO/xanthine dehydrogenase FAD-binding subunit
LGNRELLTRVRLPLHQWDYSIYKKILLENPQTSEILVFLARAQKNILTDIRVVYKTGKIFRNKNSEEILNGKLLPLSRKTAYDFIENWKDFLANRDDVSEFSKNALINNIEENVFNLSE